MSAPQLNASSRIMYQEAVARGITCTTFEDRETILMEKNGQHWYTRGSRTSFHSSVGKSIADQKPLTKQVLSHFGLPTSKGVVITEKNGLNQATISELNALRFPVVMKPINERHGKGVIVGIKNIEELQHHYLQNTTMLVEQQLQGIEYRIVCVNFKFVATAFRKPAFVTGDDQHTIQELVDEKNTHPWRGAGHTNNLSLIEVDEMVTNYLADQGYDLSSIPTTGKEVFLRKTANLSTGGEAWDVTDQVIPENRQLFEKIAVACDLNTVGIDVMCTDLSTPLTEQPYAGVIEVNASPGLRMHHFPIQGTPRNIAGMILDMVEQKIAK